MLKHTIAALTALALLQPLVVQAQDLPSYANQAAADQNVHGRVTAFDGGYNLSVRDERGYLDNVRLHPGTIINPTGLTLAPGMVVSVLGYNGGTYFSANEIDTPYQFDGAVPYYEDHPLDYYGPDISLGFFFGSGGWWHERYLGGGYGYSRGVRTYNNVRMGGIYARPAGAFRGHDFVGRPEAGGYYGHPGGRPGGAGGYSGGGHFGGAHGGGGGHSGGPHGGGGGHPH